LTKRGNNDVGSGFNDDPLWLIEGVAAYVKETGDLSILDVTAPFDNDPMIRARSSSTCGDRSTTCSNTAAHMACHSSAAPIGTTASTSTASRDTGRVVPDHGEPVGRHCRVGVIAGMLVHCAPDYAALAESVGDTEEAALARRAAAEMTRWC